MSNITFLSQLQSGYIRNVDISSNTVVVLSIKVGGGITNTELTKAILDNLVNLQNGTDFSNGTNSHTHDGRYFTQSQLQNSGVGTAGSNDIGDNNSYTNFTPAAATVKGALSGIDTALGASANSANRTLSNLTSPTDINQQLIFDTAVSSPGVYTKAETSSSSATLNISSGNSSGNASGDLDLATGSAGSGHNTGNININTGSKPLGSDNSGDLNLATGDVFNGTSGQITMFTGGGTNTGGSGSMFLGSSSASAPSGQVQIVTGGTSGGSSHSGQIDLTTGDTSGGSSNSGAVVISTGNSSSANSGDILLQTGSASITQGQAVVNARQLNVSNKPIVSVQDPSNAQDAATKNYVDTNFVKQNGTTAFTGDQSMGSHKLTNLANGTNANDAVNYSQLTSVSTGLIWQNAVNDPDLVDDTLTSPPGSPTYSITYIISGRTVYTFTVTAANATVGATYTNNGNTYTVQSTISGGTTLVTTGAGAPLASGTLTKTSGTGDATISFSSVVASSTTASGAWTGFEGHATWWDGANWIDLSTGLPLGSGSPTAVQVGDRFLVASATSGATGHVGGTFAGGPLDYYIIQVTGNTVGAFTYTETAPVNNYAVSVTTSGSQHYGESFTYVTSLTSWVNFSGPSKVTAGQALSYSGNTLNVNVDGTSIDTSSNNLEIKASGVTSSKLATSVAGDMIAGGGGSALSVDLATTSGLESTNPGNAAGQLRVKLEASNPTLQIDGSNELGVKLDAAGAIITGASGIKSQIAATGGLQITSNSLAAKLADASLASGASGLSVNEDPAGAISTGASGIKVNTDSSTTQITSNNVAVKLDTGATTGNIISSGSGLKNQLEASNPTLQISSNALGVKLDGSGAIVTGANGIKVQLEASNPTLQISTDQLGVKLDGARAITTGASGIGVNVDNSTLDISSNQVEIKNLGVTLGKMASNSVDENKIVSTTLSATGALSGGSGSKLSVNVDNSTIDITSNNLEVKNLGITTGKLADNAVTSAKINTSAVDGTTITGGGGSSLAVQQAPALRRTLVAGQSFSANTSYAVRWGLPANSETATRVYAADITTTSYNLAYVIGMIVSTSSVSAGQNVTVTTIGTHTLGSSDTNFNTNDQGTPVFLTASGTFSVTAPSTAGQAVTRIGIVSSTTTIDVMPNFVAIN